MHWDLEKIKTILPHREPFIFIDEVIEVVGTEKVVAVKHVKADESFFGGHFPGNPILPGVLIIEAMAQASIILYSISKPEIAKTDPNYYLGKVKSEFFSPVYPGDNLVIETNKVKFLDNSAIADTLAKINDRTIAKASIVFGIQKK